MNAATVTITVPVAIEQRIAADRKATSDRMAAHYGMIPKGEGLEISNDTIATAQELARLVREANGAGSAKVRLGAVTQQVYAELCKILSPEEIGAISFANIYG